MTCEPIRAGAAHAVAGGVKMAPHLERPWMEPVHRYWLAETGTPPAGEAVHLAWAPEHTFVIPFEDAGEPEDLSQGIPVGEA